MKASNWTEKDDEVLLQCIKDGMSASQIARYMNQGKSRNAVIGRIHRKGWSLPAHRQLKSADGPPVKRVRVYKAKVDPVPEVIAPAPLLFLGAPGEHVERGCQYIDGDLAVDGKMCGHPVTHKRFAYCEGHAHLCLVKPNNKKRDPATKNSPRL